MINKRNAVKLISIIKKIKLDDLAKRDLIVQITPIIKKLSDHENYAALGDARQACLVALEYFGKDAIKYLDDDVQNVAKRVKALKLPGAAVIACQWRRNRPTVNSCGCGG